MAISRYDTFPAIRWILPYGDRPTFSPDGKRIAFHRQPTQSTYELWVVDADGKNPHQLYPPPGTANPHASRPDWSWSPVVSFTNGGFIWTINPDGTDAKPYYSGGGDAPVAGMSYPSWYKDLKAIAAVRYYNDPAGVQQADIYKLTPLTQERLTFSPHPVAGRPSVNPEGTKIAFAGTEGAFSQEKNQIWIVEPPGKPYRLEPGNDAAFQGRSPNWSPKGDLIVFESTRPTPDPLTTTPLSLFIIPSGGGTAKEITLHTCVHAEWSRQQDKIVFASAEGIGIIDFR